MILRVLNKGLMNKVLINCDVNKGPYIDTIID